MNGISPPAPEDLDAAGRDLVDEYALDRIYLSDVLAGLPHFQDVHGVRRRMRERGMIGDAASSARMIGDMRLLLAAGMIEMAEVERRLTPDELARFRSLEILDKIPAPDGDPEAFEEAAFEELRELRRQKAAERAALVRQVRDDLLAGRMSKSEAVEQVGLRGWSEICASLDDEALQRVLGGDR